MSPIQTHTIDGAKDDDWVFWGKSGTLNSLGSHLYIQHHLKKAKRRLKREISLHERLYSGFETGI